MLAPRSATLGGGRGLTRLDRRAVGMLAGTVLLVAVTVPLAAGREEAFDTVLYATFPLVLGVVGTLIASRHPGNLIGWLLCGLALWGAALELGQAYGYLAAERGLPGGVAGEWLISWSWIVNVAAWVVVALLFPDGRLPGRRWRLAIWASLAGAGLLFVGQALNPGLTEDFSGGRNPLGVDSPLVEVATPAGIALLMAGLVAAVASSVRRYRRAHGVERQQLKWFAYAGLILTLVMPLAVAFWYRSVLLQVLAGLTFNAMPLAIGAAILRYRLYDIDRIISRTLAWALLTVVLGLGYAGVVLGLGRLLPQGSSLTVAAATLAVATVFQPVRRRIQAAVDRRFNRRRYDAARTIQVFSGRLREEVDLDALHRELLAVVDQTMQPTQASLWLRPPPARSTAAGAVVAGQRT
jgi:MFS family permease